MNAMQRLGVLFGFMWPIVVAVAGDLSIVGPHQRSAGPTVVKLLEVSGVDRTSVVVRPDDDAFVGRLPDTDHPFAAVIANRWPRASESAFVARQYASGLRVAGYCIGEYRLAVVVHRSNPTTSLRLSELHRILAEPGAPVRGADGSVAEWPVPPASTLSWDALGGKEGLALHVYAEGKSSRPSEVLKYRCMNQSDWALGYKRYGVRPFRKDITECMDADDVVSRVRRDPAGIGFVQYTGQRLIGVKLLPVEDDFPPDWPNEYGPGGPPLPVKSDGSVDVLAWEDATKLPRPKGPVAMKLTAELQPEYPLSEPLLLYVHPNAPEKVKEFARFCVSERGADVAEGLGFITPRQHFMVQAQRRLAQARRGDCPTITICTDTKGRRLTRELALAYTREISPLRVQPRAEDSKAMGGAFVARPLDLMLSIGVPDAKFSGRKWQESLAAGQVKPHAIAAHAIAIIAHEQLGKAELTWDELLWIAKGKVKNWGDMGVRISQTPATTAPVLDGQLPPALDDAIVLAMPDRRDATTRLFTRLLDGVSPADDDHRDSHAEVISAVQANPGTIGIINATSIPDDLDKRKLRVMAIKIRNRSVRPTEADVFSGEYPLAEGLYLWTRPATPANAQAFLDAIMTSPGIAEVIRAAGLLPVSAR